MDKNELLIEKLKKLKKDLWNLHPDPDTNIFYFDDSQKILLEIDIENLFKKIKATLGRFNLISEMEESEKIFENNKHDLLFTCSEPPQYEGDLLVLLEVSDFLSNLIFAYSDSKEINNNGKESIKEPYHTEDFKQIIAHGKKYTLTDRQAEIFEKMWEAHDQGIGEINAHKILVDLNYPTSHFRDAFKSRKEVWNELIRPGSGRGMYKLNL